MNSKIFVADYKPFVVNDGPGARVALYTSGCKFACEGCFNLDAQNFNFGVPYTDELEERIIRDLQNPFVRGISFLGGEPMLATEILIPLCDRIHAECKGKDIWAWSGYRFEELLKESHDKRTLLGMIDILVDGRFILSLKNLKLAYRGSSNQRVISVPQSLNAGKPIIWNGLKAIEQMKNSAL